MVVGLHFIFSAYGFWLPNDPRGSWSATVREFDVLRFGMATKVATTRSVAHRSHNQARRLAAKQAMRHQPVRFSGLQARAIARGFEEAAAQRNYRFFALAILPDHAHLVMRNSPRGLDRVATHLKAKATAQLTVEGLHPFAGEVSPSGRVPSPWSRKFWCPFIDSESDMVRAIQYIKENPLKAGLPAQRWRCVTPYRG